jgi:hypothetical protein
LNVVSFSTDHGFRSVPVAPHVLQALEHGLTFSGFALVVSSFDLPDVRKLADKWTLIDRLKLFVLILN